MSLSGLLESIGEYALLMKQVLTPPDRAREFFKEFLKELYKLGVTSIWLVVLISFFIGAVIVVQLALNLNYR
jgi:phospholipid/cholesterol/gamma-HCH transport system permease protein